MSGASGLRKHDHSSAGQGGTGATPSAHHTTHENGGSDEIDATGLTGVGGGSLTDHTHAATGTGSNGGGATLQPTTLDIPTATSPAQTAEGRAVWDSDDDVLTVGDGSSRKTLMNRVTTTRGDIIVRGASVDGRLAIGAANTVLHGSATDPAYSAVVEGDLSTSDITTANVVSTKHGFAPKSPADATQFLNGAATPAYAAVKDSDLATTDITTNDVSTSKHGFAPKAPNDASKFLDGTGAFSSLPAGAGTRVYNSGAFSVSASTETAVTFDTERSDSDAFHSTGSQTERLTVPTGKGGRYVIAGTVEWAASALGTLRRLSIRLNGTTYLAKDEITSIINAALPQNVETVYDLVAGDYVELVAFQDTVGSVNLQASGNYSPEFGMMLAGVAASGSGLLGLTSYATGSDTSWAITATTDADVDSTNAAVTFTAPASGNVLIKLSALMNDGNNNAHWTVREGSTTLGEAYMSSAVNKAQRLTAEIYLTGLSAGSHTYKWGAYTSAGTMNIYRGPTFGKAIIEVWPAP